MLRFAFTSEGSSLLTFLSGITVYHTDDTIHAILRGDELLYDHGVWTPGLENETFRVAVNDYTATMPQRSGLDNPLYAYKDTNRLLRNDIIDNETIVRVLREEAKQNNGHLFIDTESHIIDGDYAKPQANHLNPNL